MTLDRECSRSGCQASAAPGFNECIAHVSPADLPTIVASGPLDAARTTLDSERFGELERALPMVRGRRRWPGRVDFQGAHFLDQLELHSHEFSDHVTFAGATFDAEAAFIDCVFNRQVWLEKTVFADEATFRECAFLGGLDCRSARFEGGAHFDSHFASFFAEGAAFKGFTSFLFLQAAQSVVLANCRFEGSVFLKGVKTDGDINLTNTVFDATVSMDRTRARKLDCSGAQFRRGGDIGTLDVAEWTDFRDVAFDRAIRMRIRTANLDLRRATIAGGGVVLVEQAFVALAGAVIQRPLTLAATSLGRVIHDPPALPAPATPSLGSLAGVDATALTVDGFTLTGTRFVGAHNLDRLRLAGDYLLPRSPRGFVRRSRETIHDEHALRSEQGDAAWRLPAPRHEPEPLDLPVPAALPILAQPAPKDIAEVYRALRKGKEDARDAAGATDFYIGEMEMRRRANPRDALVQAHRLASYYGTDWKQPLALLGALIAVATVLLHWRGFSVPQSWWRSVTFALGSVVQVARTPSDGLRVGGELVQLTLRVGGPLFLGLAILALRSRVKR